MKHIFMLIIFVENIFGGRKKPSGAQNRKRAKEKNEKKEALLSKVKKLDSFLIGPKIDINLVESENDLTSNTLNDHSSLATENYMSSSENEMNLTLDLEKNNEEENIVENTVENNIENFHVSTDPFLWNINEQTINHFAKNGFVQNDDSDFSKSKKEYSDTPRYFNKSFFETKLSNGKINKRLWLIYSTIVKEKLIAALAYF